MSEPTDARERALALLRHNREFPCAYGIKAIVARGDGPGVISAVAATGARVLAVEEVPSRTGAWVSVRMRLHVQSAEAVLDVYDVLSELDSVRMTL